MSILKYFYISGVTPKVVLAAVNVNDSSGSKDTVILYGMFC